MRRDETRPGSGGDAYFCHLPLSDSCGETTWYQKMRVADDDDGDLALEAVQEDFGLKRQILRELDQRMPEDNPIVITLQTHDPVHIQAWTAQVGRCRLVLLDSNINMNSEQNRELTAQLYGGDQWVRIRQEFVLGVGGMGVVCTARQAQPERVVSTRCLFYLHCPPVRSSEPA